MWSWVLNHRHSIALASLLLLNVSVGHARPSWRQLLIGSAFLCSGVVATNALLQSDTPLDVQTVGSHQVTSAGAAEPIRVELLAIGEREASFWLLDLAGDYPSIVIFDKNTVQQMYASHLISTAREKLDDPVLKASIPNSNVLRVEFQRVVVKQLSPETVKVVIHAGPLPMTLEQDVPLKDLASGDWVKIRFGDLVVDEEGAKLVATVSMQLRYQRDRGNFEVDYVEGTVKLAALLGTQSDTGRSSACVAERIED